MEVQTFDDLCANLSQPCICSSRWKLHSKRRVGCMCSLSIVVIMIVFFLLCATITHYYVYSLVTSYEQTFSVQSLRFTLELGLVQKYLVVVVL